MPLAFTGKERDAETGLDFLGARYMSSAQGRFTSSDPEGAGATASDPQSWNGYAYARNNPLSYTDPDGRKYRVCDTQGKNCTSLTDEEYANWRASNQYVQKRAGDRLFVANDNGSETTVGSAHYYDEAAENAVASLNFLVGVFASGYLELIGPAVGATGTAGGITRLGLEGAAESANAARGGLVMPEWAKTAGGFVNWLKNLQRAGTKLTAEQADAVVNDAKQLGVDVRLEPPHPGTNWDVPHLNVGREGQAHLEVPSGYSNPSVPRGSALGPR